MFQVLAYSHLGQFRHGDQTSVSLLPALSKTLKVENKKTWLSSPLHLPSENPDADRAALSDWLVFTQHAIMRPTGGNYAET